MADALHVEARWAGGLSAVATARGHELHVDEPPHAGGRDAGMMPTELLCASLASCFCLAVAWVASHPAVTRVRTKKCRVAPRVRPRQSTPAPRSRIAQADRSVAIESAVA